MHWPENKKCCAHGIKKKKINSHDQLLTELRIKINLDKYFNTCKQSCKGTSSLIKVHSRL